MPSTSMAMTMSQCGAVIVNMITLSPLSVLVRYSKSIIQVCSQFEPLICHFLLLRQVPITSAQAVAVQDSKFARHF